MFCERKTQQISTVMNNPTARWLSRILLIPMGIGPKKGREMDYEWSNVSKVICEVLCKLDHLSRSLVVDSNEINTLTENNQCSMI